MNNEVLREGELIAGLEAGGTKCIAGIGRLRVNELPEIQDKVTIATTTPAETLARLCESFSNMSDHLGTIKALGIGSFGPLILDPQSPDFGTLDSTPKPGWSGVNLIDGLQGVAPIIQLNTDVNAAALAEYHAVAHEGIERLAYVTVGTGLGVGIVDKGVFYAGSRQLEMGHIPAQRHIRDLDYVGCCLFHGDCLEGLVCGPSIIDRYGKKLSELDPDHVAYEVIAHYLAQLVVTLSYSHAPDRIILGGGVMSSGSLMPRLKGFAASMLGNYPSSAPYNANFEDYIQPPKLGAESGLLGSMLLASAITSCA